MMGVFGKRKDRRAALGSRRAACIALSMVLAASLSPVCSASAVEADSGLDAAAQTAQDGVRTDQVEGGEATPDALDSELATETADGPSPDFVDDASVQEERGLEARAAVDGEAMGVSGLATIHSTIVADMVLDVDGASKASGAVCQLWADNTTIAQRFRLEPTNDGYVTIVNVNSGNVLDVVGGVAESGTTVQQYEPNGTDAQKWKFVMVDDGACAIVSKLSDSLVLDVEGGNAYSGARVQIYEYNGTAAQRFTVEAIEQVVEDGVYFVKSEHADKCLDITGASDDNGANAQQYSHNGTLAQKFLVAYDASTGYYTLTNGHSGKVLEVSGAADFNGANVAQYESNATNAQRWTIKRSDSGSCVVYSAVGGRVLDVSEGSAADGANVQVWAWDDVANQRWCFERTSFVGSGLQEIKNGSGFVLDVEGNATEDGSALKIWSANGTQAQKFLVRSSDGVRCTVEAANSGKVLGISGGIGPSVVLTSNTQAASQTWILRPAGGGSLYLENEANGMVLATVGSSSAQGAYVAVSAASGALCQKWTFSDTVALADGCFEIRSATDRSFAVDVEGASQDNGAKVQIYRSNGTQAQKFWAKRQSDGTYVFINLASGKSLDVKDWQIDATTGAGVVQQWETNGSSAQKWRVEYASGGLYALYSVCGDGGSCLDVDGNVMEDGRSVGVYRWNGTSAQMWSFVPSEGQDPSSPGQETPDDNGGAGGTVGTTTYEHYVLSLEAMVDLQMDNPYVTATRDAVRACVDPSNTSASTMYQFADLRGYSGVSASTLDAYIDSTELGRTGMLHGMGYAFVKASQEYRVNEVYLLCHAILESGWGTSDLADGFYYDGSSAIEGTYYPTGTYYNFYGIGAYDSSPLSGGRSMAVQNGWSSPEKAIMGAAQWIASNYTYASLYAQPTLYDMKWDVKRSNVTLQRGWHQYATDIQWARSIATLMGECYATTDASGSLDYLVPVYAG